MNQTGKPEEGHRAALESLGWQRRSVSSEPQLSEAVEMYRSLGMEVLLVSVWEEGAGEGDSEACVACFAAEQDPSRYRVIYTRLKGAETNEHEPM